MPATNFRARHLRGAGALSEDRRTLGEVASPPHPDVSFRVLSDVARLLVSESDLTRLLESIADSVETLIPYDGLVLFQAEPLLRQLRPIFARHPRAEEVYRRGPVEYGVGITGFGAEHSESVMSN